MTDICTNTKRMTEGMGFRGATANDLFRIAAQFIEYAGEESGASSYVTERIPVAHCVYGVWFREEDHPTDTEEQRAHILRQLRDENPDIMGDRDSFEFEYDGGTYLVVTSGRWDAVYHDACEQLLEYANDEWEHAKGGIGSWIGDFIEFNRDAFVDAITDEDIHGQISSWDGMVHEANWCEYGAGRGACGYRNDHDRDLVIRRDTLYMWRTD